MRNIKQLITVIFITTVLTSCGILNQNLLFQTVDNKCIIADTVLKQIAETKANYIIQPSDLIELKVFTNLGERLIDPNGEFSSGVGNNPNGNLQSQQGNLNNNQQFIVWANRTLTLPMVGVVDVAGLTMHQLDSVLQVRYSKFYEGVFVTTKCVNRRVIVFGAMGGGLNSTNQQNGNSMNILGSSVLGANTNGGATSMGPVGVTHGLVVNLPYEKMHLIEVLAMVGGFDMNAKSYNIKLIRGDLKNPNVEIIDLSTIEGLKKSNVNIQPNDIIYIERYRRRASQVLTQMSPYISILALVTTLIILLKK